MRKKMLCALMCLTMVAGLMTGCGSDGKSSKNDTKSDDGKVVLNVINYHVGTDYAADYYEYLFDAFQKTEEGKNVEFKLKKFLQQILTTRRLNY